MAQPTPPNNIPNLTMTTEEFNFFNESVTKCYPFVSRQAQNEYEEAKGYIEIDDTPIPLGDLVSLAISYRPAYLDSNTPNEYKSDNFTLAALEQKQYQLVCKFQNAIGVKTVKEFLGTDFSLATAVLSDNVNYAVNFLSLLTIVNNTGVTTGTNVTISLRPIGSAVTYQAKIVIN